MNSNTKKRLWVGVVVVVVALLAFASPSIIAGLNGTADAAGGCSMGSKACDMSSSGGGCGMMSANKDSAATGSGKNSAAAPGGCAMMGDKTGGCNMADCSNCSMLTGTVVAVNKRDGSITVKVKPAATNAVATADALSQIKVKDTLSIAVMFGKDGKSVANAGATALVASYACPMHPEVTSDNPGTCSKCGMNLQKISKGQK